jgi:hypothetical protein
VEAHRRRASPAHPSELDNWRGLFGTGPRPLSRQLGGPKWRVLASHFCVEFFFALRIGSVALFADSIDFLEDASVNILIFVAMGWSLLARKRLSKFFALLLLVPAISVLISTIYEINNPSTPDAISLTAVGTGALIVNFSCAFLLAKFRSSAKSLVLAAYLSARNDATSKCGNYRRWHHHYLLEQCYSRFSSWSCHWNAKC